MHRADLDMDEGTNSASMFVMKQGEGTEQFVQDIKVRVRGVWGWDIEVRVRGVWGVGGVEGGWDIKVRVGWEVRG